jgi:hypothetical protein
MAPPRKNSNDLSQSTLRRGENYYTILHHRKVEEVIGAKIGARAKLTYFALHPILSKRDGLLMDPLDEVAKRMGYDSRGRGKPHTERLQDDLDELIGADILRKLSNGIVYCPRMFEDRKPGQLATIDAIWHHLAPNGKNPPGDTAQIRVEKIRAYSCSATAEPTISDNLNCTNKTDQDQESGTGSLARPVLFPGLSVKDLETVKGEFPHLDFAAVYQKFLDYHTSEGTERASLNFLRGWFKKERGGTADRQHATAAPSGLKTAKPVKTGSLAKMKVKKVLNPDYDKRRDDPSEKYNEELCIGNFELPEDLEQKILVMPPKTDQEANQWLANLVGMPWDTMNALHTFGSAVTPYQHRLFYKSDTDDEDIPEAERGKWQGYAYESPEAKEQREKAAAERKAEREAIKKARETEPPELNTDENWFACMVEGKQMNPVETLRCMDKKNSMPDVAEWVEKEARLIKDGWPQLTPRDRDHAWSIMHKSIQLGLIVETDQGFFGKKRVPTGATVYEPEAEAA